MVNSVIVKTTVFIIIISIGNLVAFDKSSVIKHKGTEYDLSLPGWISLDEPELERIYKTSGSLCGKYLFRVDINDYNDRIDNKLVTGFSVINKRYIVLQLSERIENYIKTNIPKTKYNENQQFITTFIKLLKVGECPDFKQEDQWWIILYDKNKNREKCINFILFSCGKNDINEYVKVQLNKTTVQSETNNKFKKDLERLFDNVNPLPAPSHRVFVKN